MKTIIARFTELKTNVAGTADSEFDDLDYNKVDTALKSVGVSIKDASGQFRDLDDVFLELSGKWDGLDRNTQRYIATIAAGARQQSRFIAMMDNYERTMELVDVAYDSAGKSSEQFAKYQDTLEYKLNQLSNTWEQFRTKFFNSEFFKGIVDGLNFLVEKINTIDLKDFLILGTIGLTLGKSMITNFITSLKESTSGISTAVKQVREQIQASLTKDPIKIRYSNQDIEKVKTSLRSIGFETDNINQKTGSLIIQYVKTKQQIDLIEAKMIKEGATQDEINAELEERRNLLKRITEEMQRQNIEADKLEASYEGANDAQLSDLQNNANNANLSSSGVVASTAANALSSMVITSIMTSIATEDLGAAIISGLGAAITSVLPVIINAVMPKIISVVGGLIAKAVAAIGTAALGVIAGVVVAIVGAIAIGIFVAHELRAVEEANHKAKMKQLKEIDSLTEQMNEKQIESLKEANKLQKQIEELKSLTERFKELNEKAYLTADEEKEFESIKNTLNQNYSEVVRSYDENSGEMRLNTDAIERLTEELTNSFEDEVKNSQYYSNIAITGKQDAKETASRISDYFGSMAANLWGGETGTAYLYSTSSLIGETFLSDSKVKYIPQDADPREMEYKTGFLGDYYSAAGSKEEYHSQQINLWEDAEFEEYIKNVLLDAFGAESDLFKELGLTGQDLVNFSSLNEFLKKSNLSLQEFFNRVSELAVKTSNNIDVNAEKRKSVYNRLLDSEIKEGFSIDEQLATTLSYTGDDDEEIDSSVDITDKVRIGSETNKNFLRDYLQESVQEGQTDTGDAGVQKNLEKIEIGGSTADALIRKWASKWEEAGQQLMSGSDGNLATWSELPTEFVEFLESLGYTADNWDKARKNAKTSADLVQNFFNKKLTAEMGENIGVDVSTLNEPDKNALIKLQDLYNTAGELTQEEYISQIKQLLGSITDGALKQAIMDSEGFVLDENDGSLTLDEAVEGSVSARYKQAAEQIEELGATNMKNLGLQSQEALLKWSSSANLGGQYATDFLNDMASFLDEGDFSSDVEGILTSIDVTQPYSDLMLKSQDYIDALVDAGLNATQAATVFEEYIEKAREHIFTAITSMAGISALKTNLNTGLKGVLDSYKTINDAQQEMLDNGKISFDTYLTLIEEGFDEYVDITSDGYVLLQDKAEEAFVAQSRMQYDIYKQSIKDNEKALSDLKDFDVSSLEIEVPIVGPFMPGQERTTTMYVEDFDEAAEYFKNNSEALEDYKGKYKEVIQTMIDNDWTWDEYLNNQEQINAELRAGDSEAYIQHLETIASAIAEMEESVNDLEEELADLNEQLIEDQEAVNEAEQALHEAKYGTEDFQSGLDGLINYERPLERINSEIERTKELLTEVSDIESAGDSLEKLRGLYENKLSTIQAESNVIDDSLANIQETILANYGQYIDGFDEYGNPIVNFAYQDAQMSDILKTEGYEELINQYNEYLDKKYELQDEELAAEKEWQEMISEARDEQIAMEDKMREILKEKMQEEVDALNDKYAAMEEADSNYVDALQEAIDKQRELRDRENEYEDLATKEKKLALMQRDTSGANRKEAMSLEKEVEEDRQNLLDNEVDRLIESMQEMYEKQAEAHQLEIEVAEATMEDIQLLNSMIQTEMSQFSSADDYKAWLMENDPAVADMTDAQLESYLEEADSLFSGYAQYVALTTEELALRTDVINQKADEMFVNTEENITNIGTVIQDSAQKASEEAITSAQEAYDSAVEKMNDTQEKIAETKLELEKAEASAASLHGATMDEMVLASQSAMAEVSTYAAKQLADMLGYDLSDDEDIAEFAEVYNFVNDRGEITSNLYNAIKDAGGDISQYKMASQRYEVYDVSGSGNKTSFGYYETPEAAGAAYNQLIAQGHDADTLHWNGAGGYASGTFDDSEVKQHGILWPDKSVSYFNTMQEAVDSIEDYFTLSPHNATDGNRKTWAQDGNYQIFKTGGLVNYTGPAWVDGTPTKPEAFLSAEDTARIGEAARLLAQLPIFNSTSNAKNATSTNVGDTSIEIHINVEKIDSDYDVDQMIERVKQDIVDVSKPIGSSVILKK